MRARRRRCTCCPTVAPTTYRKFALGVLRKLRRRVAVGAGDNGKRAVIAAARGIHGTHYEALLCKRRGEMRVAHDVQMIRVKRGLNVVARLDATNFAIVRVLKRRHQGAQLLVLR